MNIPINLLIAILLITPLAYAEEDDNHYYICTKKPSTEELLDQYRIYWNDKEVSINETIAYTDSPALTAELPSASNHAEIKAQQIIIHSLQDTVYVYVQLPSGELVKDTGQGINTPKAVRYHTIFPIQYTTVFDYANNTLITYDTPLFPARKINTKKLATVNAKDYWSNTPVDKQTTLNLYKKMRPSKKSTQQLDCEAVSRSAWQKTKSSYHFEIFKELIESFVE